MQKLWGGRFSAATKSNVDKFTASISFDYQLALDDIAGSLAHVSMLGKCNILTADEVKLITHGLKRIAENISQIEFKLDDEDIHMNIERLLYAEIGEVAGKLHTARSRNDQVALDLRLYLRRRSLS